MTLTQQQILASALALPEVEQVELAEALLAGGQPPIPELTGEAWLAELDRRSAEMDAGGTTWTSWADVKEKARQKLKIGEQDNV